MRGNIPKGEHCRIKTDTTETFCVCFIIDPRTGRDYCPLYDEFIKDYVKTDGCKKEKPEIVATEGRTVAPEQDRKKQESIQPKKRGRKPKKKY